MSHNTLFKTSTPNVKLQTMNKQTNKPTPHEAFREWFNDFLTVSAFAEWYGIEEKEARRLIEEGRKVEHSNGKGAA